MTICELMFNAPDPENPDYSLHEVDYFAWVPAGSPVPNHRLSLRKNLINGAFEVYRRYYERRTIVTPSMTILTSDDTGMEEVVFSGGFEEALRFADAEYEKFHGKKEPDKPCRHSYPQKALTCYYDIVGRKSERH